MKKQNHRNQFDGTIEKVEQIIEGIEPSATLRLVDIARMVNMAKMDSVTKNATFMLLEKYGIRYTL